jgi:dUTP pyrophosphatase
MPQDLSLEIRRLPSSDGLPLPAYMTAGASGMDLHAALEMDLILEPGDIAVVATGLAVAVPEGYEAQLRPRSGLAVSHGIGIPNAPATIDSDYRGELRVPLINLGRTAFTITRGMRIAQLVVAPVVRVRWAEVSELPPTTRGSGGFGHSGL